MKEFNTTAVCIPSKHYMVDITDKVNEIRKMVEKGKYFTINRARQYGKTTTLNALTHLLKDRYYVISLDFQDIENGSFRDGGRFSKAFTRMILDASEFDGLNVPKSIIEKFERLEDTPTEEVALDDLFRVFRYWFKEEERQFVLIIDEVDSATNNQVFLDFLALLLSLYIKREKDPGIRTFQSVILAGVTDIKHLKSKIRDEDQSKVNSPWNIAADFLVDMSFSAEGIRGMLDEYEADHNTGMDTAAIAKSIRDYTSGYPFLVSRICQLIDRDVSKMLGDLSQAWTERGVDEAVKMILMEDNTLFQSLSGKLTNNTKLRETLRSILMEGARISYNSQNDYIAQMQMYGFIRNENGSVRISNRIFETLLYNLFLSEEELKNNAFYKEGELAKNIKD